MAFPRPEKGFFKGLITLAIPMMLQSFISFSVNFADNLMVGTLGEFAISGVYLGNQLFTLVSNIVMGIDNAMLVLAAQYWGRKDTESIKRIFAIAFRLVLIISAAATIAAVSFPRHILDIFSNDQAVIEQGVSYIRYVGWTYFLFASSQILLTSMKSVESVKLGMYSSFISLSVNVVLNYILIFGKLGFPALGISGAAIATLVSRIIEVTVIAVYVLVIDKKLKLAISDFFKWDKLLFRDYVRYGLPIIAGQIVWGLNNVTQGAIIGNIGAAATSAVSIVSMVTQLIFVLLSSLAGAIGITTGKLVGAGEVERVKNHARVVQIMFLTIGVCMFFVIRLIRDPIISLYSIAPETVTMARQFLNVLSFTMIGTCYQGFPLGALVKSGGDTKFVFINDTIFVWGIVIPSALIAQNVFHAAPWVVYLCLKSDELLKCPVAYFKINSFNWIKNLTRDNTVKEEVTVE